MPQMMPLSWVSMIIMTIMLLITLSAQMYFHYSPSSLKTNKYKTIKFNYWPWKW